MRISIAVGVVALIAIKTSAKELPKNELLGARKKIPHILSLLPYITSALIVYRAL